MGSEKQIQLVFAELNIFNRKRFVCNDFLQLAKVNSFSQRSRAHNMFILICMGRKAPMRGATCKVSLAITHLWLPRNVRCSGFCQRTERSKVITGLEICKAMQLSSPPSRTIRAQRGDCGIIKSSLIRVL